MPFLTNCEIVEMTIQAELDHVNETRQLEQTSNSIPLIPMEECVSASGLRRSRVKIMMDGPFAETKEFAAG